VTHQPYDPRSEIDTRFDKEVPTQARQAAGSTDSLRKDQVVLCGKMVYSRTRTKKTTEIPAEYGSRALPEKR
jgi:hypothetical protein